MHHDWLKMHIPNFYSHCLNFLTRGRMPLWWMTLMYMCLYFMTLNDKCCVSPSPLCARVGTGWCEEGIHKNRGQILPAAETGRAAQDGHGQYHRPVFVQEGDWNKYTLSLLTSAITKTLPNKNGQSQKAFTLQNSALCGVKRDKGIWFIWIFVEH